MEKKLIDVNQPLDQVSLLDLAARLKSIKVTYNAKELLAYESQMELANAVSINAAFDKGPDINEIKEILRDLILIESLVEDKPNNLNFELMYIKENSTYLSLCFKLPKPQDTPTPEFIEKKEVNTFFGKVAVEKKEPKPETPEKALIARVIGKSLILTDGGIEAAITILRENPANMLTLVKERPADAVTLVQAASGMAEIPEINAALNALPVSRLISLLNGSFNVLEVAKNAKLPDKIKAPLLQMIKGLMKDPKNGLLTKSGEVRVRSDSGVYTESGYKATKPKYIAKIQELYPSLKTEVEVGLLAGLLKTIVDYCETKTSYGILHRLDQSLVVKVFRGSGSNDKAKVLIESPSSLLGKLDNQEIVDLLKSHASRIDSIGHANQPLNELVKLLMETQDDRGDSYFFNLCREDAFTPGLIARVLKMSGVKVDLNGILYPDSEIEEFMETFQLSDPEKYQAVISSIGTIVANATGFTERLRKGEYVPVGPNEHPDDLLDDGIEEPTAPPEEPELAEAEEE